MLRRWFIKIEGEEEGRYNSRVLSLKEIDIFYIKELEFVPEMFYLKR